MVSVIVPVYQVKDYLSKCIESICTQDYEDLEIILVDDGSIDGSSEICDVYAEKDDRIVVIHKENGGSSSARNKGIEVAHGEYIAFIDGDDWVDRRYISSMYKVCKENACQVCQCGFYNVADGLEQLCDQVFSPILYSGKEFLYSEFTLLSWECEIPCNKLYNAELFENVRFPEGVKHEDEATIYRILDKAEKVGLISARLYFYRRRPGSNTGDTSIYRKIDLNQALEDRAAFYAQHDDLDLLYLTKARHYQWLTLALKRHNCVQEEQAEYDALCKKKELLSNECRENKVLRKDFFKRQAVFPFDKVEKGSRIALYGAGKIGEQFFLQIRATNYCEILGWFDENYITLRGKGIPVQSPDDLGEICSRCDYYVIAIKDIQVASEVKKMISTKYGVKASKIISVFNTTLQIM